MTKLEILIEAADHWWFDIIEPLMEGKARIYKGPLHRSPQWIGNRVSYSTHDCACCQRWYKRDCNGCPLKEFDLICSYRGSPWREFIYNPSLETALDMWAFLRLLIEIERQGE